jgi:hypothetical protein
MPIQVYLQPLPFDQLNWDDISQRCQAHILARVASDDHYIEIFWDRGGRYPIVHHQAQYFRVKTQYNANTVSGMIITLRDCFRALELAHARFALTWPDDEGHNIENLLDTFVIDAPVCQFEARL